MPSKSPAKPAPKASAKPAVKAAAKTAEKAPAKAAKAVPAKAAPKAAEKSTPPAKPKGAKRGPKPKGSINTEDDVDLEDLIDDTPEPVVETGEGGEKAKPLRMKLSKAKERALMKEFGLDETVLSEEDLAKRRVRLKALIKLGKTRGYLTHAEINDHLPDKLVDAETLEVVYSLLNDIGIAVYETTPVRKPCLPTT
jgi:RNA polymerase primary sigma factor